MMTLSLLALTATSVQAQPGVPQITYLATATRHLHTIWVINSRFKELLDSNMVPATRFAIQKAAFKPIPKPKTSKSSQQ